MVLCCFWDSRIAWWCAALFKGKNNWKLSSLCSRQSFSPWMHSARMPMNWVKWIVSRHLRSLCFSSFSGWISRHWYWSLPTRFAIRSWRCLGAFSLLDNSNRIPEKRDSLKKKLTDWKLMSLVIQNQSRRSKRFNKKDGIHQEELCL